MFSLPSRTNYVTLTVVSKSLICKVEPGTHVDKLNLPHHIITVK